MGKMFRLAMLAGAAYGAKQLYDNWSASQRTGGGPTPGRRVGYDTPTGTDPEAKWAEPGYQDKSLGQAVEQDRGLVERLVDESEGDLELAEARFRAESAGAPALRRQEHEDEI
jgi:hypothetical protein